MKKKFNFNWIVEYKINHRVQLPITVSEQQICIGQES